MAITREQVLQALRGRGRPLLSARVILARLGGHRGQAKSLRALLRALEGEGRLERISRQYRVTRGDGLVEAVVLPGSGASLKAKDERGSEWSVSRVPGLCPGDRVLLWPASSQAGQRRGEILQVLSGHRDTWVGIFGRDSKGSFVTPYRDETNWRVFISDRDGGRARYGEVVVVAVAVESAGKSREAKKPRHRERGRRSGRSPKARERSASQPLRGRIVERLGRPGDAEADFRAIAWRHRLALDFPPEVLAEAEAQEPDIPSSEIERRLDLRDRCFVTIDPPSARDHDDAVSVESVAGGSMRLWVAIADVAHFVSAGSALDREALRRGNSFYFPDRAIPMLPERLSGDLCSLRPDTDRLALVVELTVDADGACHGAKFHEAVVRSRQRLAYAEAAEVMGGLRAPAGWHGEVAEQLVLFANLAERLLRHRTRDGSLDFDLPAPEVLLDPHSRPRDIVRAERNAAHRAVEDAMLVANRAVASALSDRSLPAVFRVHEPPSEDRLAELRELFQSLGLMDARTPMELPQIAQALGRARGRPEESLVNQAALRSMRQARYHPENLGHYALGFESYLHFTSPIRRYADLVVHRAVKDHLVSQSAGLSRGSERAAGDGTAGEWNRMVSVRTSFRERVAMQAEREILELKRCALMSSRVGEEFVGTVTGVARHGLYVTLDQPFVDGLIHVSELGDFMEYDERTKALVARRSGRRFQLGERLAVRLASVDPLKGWISLRLKQREARS